MEGTGRVRLFVLLTPDALHRGLAGRVVERLLGAGLQPLRHRVLRPRPAELDGLYRVNVDRRWETHRYRLLDLLHGLGPSLALVAEATSMADADAAFAGIREDWAVNEMLGLVHPAASEMAARAQEAILFPRRARPAPDGAEALRLRCRVLDSRQPPDGRGFAQVLGGLRARLAAALLDDLDATGRRLAAGWSRGGVPAVAAPGAGARLAAHLRSGDRHPLAGVLSCEFRPGAPGRLDLDRTWPLLAAYGVTTDRWERLVLATSLVFPPAPG